MMQKTIVNRMNRIDSISCRGDQIRLLNCLLFSRQLFCFDATVLSLHGYVIHSLCGQSIQISFEL